MKNNSLFRGKDGQNYLFPFLLVTCLFLLWGLAHGLLDVLNKHFQDSLHLTKAQSGAVQASAYGAYFLMAIPAGIIARRFGYKMGILVGLSLFAIGAFWFIPALGINTFWAFLLGLLIIFCGLTCLETVANPYTTVLGPPETAASRINFAQTFNAIGWILGPLVGSLLIFENKTDKSIVELFFDGVNKVFTGATGAIQSMTETIHEVATADNSVLILPYVGLGVVVLMVLAMFFFTGLPEVKADDGVSANSAVLGDTPLIRQRHFVFAVVAQFLYVAAQTGVNSFFINYAIETKDIVLTEVQAGLLLGMGGMGLFAIGRFTGSMVMRALKPNVLLGTFALLNTLLMLFTSINHNRFGIMALMLCYLFMSVMFPSIFALGLRGLGEKTKTASSILVMTIVGGAICPWLMGKVGAVNMNVAFLIPMVCFAFISFYGYAGSKVKETI